MKTVSALFLTITLVLPAFVFGQSRQYPDSIRVELPELGAIVIFELRVYAKDKEIISTLPARLSELVKHIKMSISEDQWSNAYSVTVTPDKNDDDKKRSHIVITRKKEDVTRLRVAENIVLELLPPGWDLTIRMERAVVHVYVPDLTGLEAISRKSFDPLLTHLASEEEFASAQRMGAFVRVVMRDDGITTAGESGHRLPADMLGLHPGAGVGIAGDQFYPEFNFITAIYLANRFQSNRQRIAAGYELKLFSGRTEENTFRSSPASFVTLSYGVNFSGTRPRWTVLGVGYMVHNRSDIFTGKTLKVFLESDIGSEKLNIIPELYLTDDFKKSVFGIKLNYKF